MKKTIKDFTPEIQAKIPGYMNRALDGVFDGGRCGKFSLEKATEAVEYNYDFCGYKKPVVIVAENPLESQLFFNYIKSNPDLMMLCHLAYTQKNNIDISEVNAIQLDSQLYSQLYSQLDSQLRSQLHSQLQNQLDSQLDSQLQNQLESQLHSQLRSQLRSQLQNQLHSQLRSQLQNQLDSQLHSQLQNQLDSQLRSQLQSQLRSQLSKYNYDYLTTLNVYSDCYYSWYEFIRKEFDVELSINEEFQKLFELQRNSGIYSAVFSEMVCVVSKYPKKVHRNELNDLHNTSSVAVVWGYSCEETSFDCFYVNGRNIEQKYFDKANNGMTIGEFNGIENEDIRAGIVTIIKENKGDRGLMEFLGAVEVDSKEVNHANGYSETLRLFKTKSTFAEACDRNGDTNQPYAWINMTCPSTGQGYLISTCPSFNDVTECAKWHRPNLVPSSVEYVWQSAN